MENFKFIIFSTLAVSLLVFLGYWSFTTLEPGAVHVDKQARKTLEKENADLKKEVEDLKDELALLQPKEEAKTDETYLEKTAPENPDSTPIFSSKYQTLINGLQELISNKIIMKRGSRGTRVGVVQEFLNLYNKTSTKVDNDYGASTETSIKNFQKAEGLTVSGQVGISTFQKMIDWLKKQ